MNRIKILQLLLACFVIDTASAFHNKESPVVLVDDFRNSKPYYTLTEALEDLRNGLAPDEVAYAFLSGQPEQWLIDELARVQGHHKMRLAQILLWTEQKALYITPKIIFKKDLVYMTQFANAVKKLRKRFPDGIIQFPTEIIRTTKSVTTSTTTTEIYTANDLFTTDKYTTDTVTASNYIYTSADEGRRLEEFNIDFYDDEEQAEFEMALIKAHNIKRKRVGLNPLTVDVSLTNFAKDWTALLAEAPECELLHSSETDREEIGAFELIGENLFVTNGTLDASVVVNRWAVEIKKFHYGPIGESCTNFINTLHGTQVYWQDTTHIGCAFASCVYTDKIIVSCNYGPMGNVYEMCPFQPSVSVQLNIDSIPCAKCVNVDKAPKMLRKT